MAQLHPYLAFDGNCSEAMNFYKEALNGTLELTTVGESPGSDTAPAGMKDKVMHASLEKDGAVLLFASDMIGPEGAKQGNTITLSLNCESEDEINSAFKNLSEGAKSTRELKQEFWGDTYGEVVDKFGMRWMFNYHKEKAEA
ncbi:MAG: hypothetical protein JWN01_1249 [Patescibacteria group bacterium]|nr:hypothetical protein [Patescibacteria group bacterium]